jgi:hypothetical protein
MSEQNITLYFTKREIEKLLDVLQHSISQELEIMQDNTYEINGETFVVFLESVQEQTNLYVYISEAKKRTEETEE